MLECDGKCSLAVQMVLNAGSAKDARFHARPAVPKCAHELPRIVRTYNGNIMQPGRSLEVFAKPTRYQSPWLHGWRA